MEIIKYGHNNNNKLAVVSVLNLLHEWKCLRYETFLQQQNIMTLNLAHNRSIAHN